ncbi:hypothetical protein CR513_28845, partial [Mucuna pruriens]
ASTINKSDFSEYNSSDFNSDFNFGVSKFQESEPMENNDRTLKELATPDMLYQPWCIQHPQLKPAQSYELKSGLIHLLPKFHGLAGEDPHKHLKEFHVVNSIMRPQGIPKDYIKMKAFPFSLNEVAKDWLYLQPILFNTWGDMKRMFLEKFFPASRTATIRKEICGIRQHFGKTLHEYWEIFNKLCATCPHHQINEQLLIQYFYEGLMMMDQSMIDAASGRSLMDKTPTTARHLISNIASNTQQFGTRGAATSRMVNEVGVIDSLRLENQLIELTSLVKQLVVRQHQPSAIVRVYGICTFVEHPTDMCPTLQETESDHPESVGSIAKPEIPSTIVPTTATTESAIIGQLTIFGGTDEAVGNKKPGQKPRLVNAESELEADSRVPQQARSIPLPFPTRTLSTRKPETDENLLKMFQKVEINISLLDAIKQIPKYAKFLKELCVHKRKKMKGGVELGGIVSTLTKSDGVTTESQQTLPKKCRDPEIFFVPCTISECTFTDAMLDLGASINVMPTSIYKSLNFGDLEPTGMTIQLTNKSIVQPLGVLEDVLVQVNELIFPADFYMLDMEDETSRKGSTLILG